MLMQNPLDDLLATTALIERIQRRAKPIPGASALVDDVFDFAHSRGGKPEVVVDSSAKESGFLRHQPSKAEKKHGHSAGQRLVGGESSGLREDKVGSGDEAVNILHESERARSGMARRINP